MGNRTGNAEANEHSLSPHSPARRGVAWDGAQPWRGTWGPGTRTTAATPWITPTNDGTAHDEAPFGRRQGAAYAKDAHETAWRGGAGPGRSHRRRVPRAGARRRWSGAAPARTPAVQDETSGFTRHLPRWQPRPPDPVRWDRHEPHGTPSQHRVPSHRRQVWPPTKLYCWIRFSSAGGASVVTLR